MQSNKKLSTGLMPMLFVCMALLLITCEGGSKSGGTTTTSTQHHPKAPGDQQIYITPEAGVPDIQTFDPALSIDSFSYAAIELVFTGLVQLDDNLKVQPQLAASYYQEADGLSWTFTLRDHLMFSDGTPLTSADVLYSIDRALQPTTHSSFCPNLLSFIKDADKLAAGKITTLVNDSLWAPDARTVKIVTNKPAAYFLDALTLPCSYVVERNLIRRYGNRFTDYLSEGGSDGPFMVKEYTHNQRIVFVPNPNYYGPKPQLREVIYPFITSADTAYREYQTNRVDTAIVPTAEVASARNPADEFHQMPQLWLNFYTMNYLTKPFDNIKIRQAFELAINKDVIAHAVWKDTVIATNHIIPMGMPGYNPRLTGPDGTLSTAGNPALAAQLFQLGLKEEGWSSVAQVPSITLSYASFGFQTLRDEVAVLIETWQKVLGVSVHPQELESGKLIDEFLAATNNPQGLQLWGTIWNFDYPDPQDVLQPASIGIATNYAHNESSDVEAQQAVQQQLAAAEIDQDQQHRLQQYMNAEQKLVNDVFWLPMYQLTSTFVLKPCVQGFVFNAESLIPPNDWGNVYISTDTPCAQPS